MSDESSAESAPSPSKKTFFDRKLADRPERFEDFSPWQEARRLASRLYEVTDKAEFANDRGVRDEIRRAIVEVMTHLAAAVESSSEKGFAYGLGQAKSAAAGLRSLVFVAVDQSYFTEQEQTELVGRAASVTRMIGSQIARLKRAESTDDKRRPGGFAPKRPGSFGAKKPYGSKPGGGKPGGGFGGKKPYKPKRDE